MIKKRWIIYLATFLALHASHGDVKISQLPLGSAASTNINDSFPYVNSVAGETQRLDLSDLVNLPAFQSEFTLLVPSQSGQSGKCLGTNGTITAWVSCGSGGGSGTVTSFSFTNGSGFTGTVTNSATTPALSLGTSVTGVLKGNGSAISAATSGTDYVVPSGSITGSAGSLTQSITSGLPVIGNGTGIAGGTKSGTTTEFVTTTGTQTSGDCVEIDSNGNHIDAGAPCGSGGGGVSSVGLSVPSFLSVTGSPITSSGSFAVSLSGTALPVSSGGTGSTSYYGNPSPIPSTILMDVGGVYTPITFPSPTNAGQYVMATGSGFALGTPAGGGGTPGGANSDVQYNSAGSFGGNSSFTYDGAGNVTATNFNGSLTGNATNLAGPRSIPSPGPSGNFPMSNGSSYVSGSITAGAGITVTNGSTVAVTDPIPTPSPSASGCVLQWNGSAWVPSCSVLVSQAQLVGQLKFTGSSGAWTTTATSFTTFTPPTGVVGTPTAGTVCTYAGSNALSITCPYQGLGAYILKYEGDVFEGVSSFNAYFQFTDGTNNAKEQSVIYGATSGVGNAGIQQSIVYGSSLAPPSTTSLTFTLLGKNDSGGTAEVFGTTALPGVISVFYFPTQAQAAQTVATSAANWSGSSTLSGSTSSTFPSDFGSVSGSVSVIGTPQNISCSATASTVGWTCTGSGILSGSNYHVCASGYISGNTVNQFSSVSLTDGSNSVISGEQRFTPYAASTFAPFSSCGNYTGASTSLSFKLRGGATSGSTATITPTTFSIESASTPVNAVTLTGGVSTNAAGNWRVESVSTSLCTSSPCSITGGTGFVSSITRSGTGAYTVNFSSAFSAAPICSVTGAFNTSSSKDSYCENNGNTTTSLSVNCSYATNNAQDSGLNVICQGPR